MVIFYLAVLAYSYYFFSSASAFNAFLYPLALNFFYLSFSNSALYSFKAYASSAAFLSATALAFFCSAFYFSKCSYCLLSSCLAVISSHGLSYTFGGLAGLLSYQASTHLSTIAHTSGLISS